MIPCWGVPSILINCLISTISVCVSLVQLRTWKPHLGPPRLHLLPVVREKRKKKRLFVHTGEVTGIRVCFRWEEKENLNKLEKLQATATVDRAAPSQLFL